MWHKCYARRFPHPHSLDLDPTQTLAKPQLELAPAMVKKEKPGWNGHEACPSSGKVRKRIPVGLGFATYLWEHNEPASAGTLRVPDHWHLNDRRLPVPPERAFGQKRCTEIARRRNFLPSDLRENPKFSLESGR